jgi:hypothetical protein
VKPHDVKVVRGLPDSENFRDLKIEKLVRLISINEAVILGIGVMVLTPLMKSTKFESYE